MMTHKRQKEVRLRTMFKEWQLITALPAWSSCSLSSHIGQELDDVLFARYKDILVDPERFYSMINAWLIANTYELETIYNSLQAQYDPLSNYDMIEKEGTAIKEGEKISEAKRYGAEKTTQTVPDTKSSRYSTTYDNASAGRLDSYTEDIILPGTAPTLDGHNAQSTVTEQTPDGQGRQGTELTERYTGDVTIQAPESTFTADKGEQRELIRKGNIGVTTSQQMLESEIELRVKYQWINIFCKWFVKDNTIGVYDI